MIDDESLRSLEKLHNLKNNGIITEADFEQAKQHLLGQRPSPNPRLASEGAEESKEPLKPYPPLPEPQDFQQWIVYALRRYAVFEGRSCRKEYWMFHVTISVVALVFLASVSGAPPSSGPNPVTVCAMIALLGLIVPAVAVQVRRFHDQNKTGWFALLNLIPYVGPFIVMGFMFVDGTPAENQFGPDPKDR